MNKLSLSLQTKLSQKLLITPQMKQSLNLLQMPVTELLQEVNEILSENPVLEEADIQASEDEKIKDEFLEILKRVDWDDYYGHHDEIFYTPQDDEQADYDKFISKQLTLNEHLLFQLNILDLSDEDLKIGEYIIGNLTEAGYFRLDIGKSSEELGVSVEHFEKILKLVQQFDPTGIASRNLSECILIQLKSMDVNPYDIEVIKEIIENYEDEFINGNFDKIKKELELDDETFDTLLKYIRKTDPKPGLKFSGGNNYITPDVFIIKKDGKYEVSLNESEFPSLKLNSYYLKLIKTGNLDKETKQFVEEKIKNAIWLLKSLNQRQKAIYKVVKAIVEVQKDFLDDFSNHLKPLKLKDIADMTDLHESTVSRVTAGKYAQCGHAIIELKSFFMKSLSSVNGDVSVTSVKEEIKRIIESEPKEKPYSDQKIVEILQKKGIKIARRTVAKYREELSIPSTSQRRKLRR
jgi:RNA polymerase sigma-54 factor